MNPTVICCHRSHMREKTPDIPDIRDVFEKKVYHKNK